ncbi:hypothetical protein QZH41_015127, partial [Actinostola sp. cb2023]
NPMHQIGIPDFAAKEPLAFIRKAQATWEKRIVKSINSMCTELSLPLATKRSVAEQANMSSRFLTLGAELDEKEFERIKPVYAPKDFFEALIAVENPNFVPLQKTLSSVKGWGLIQVNLYAKNINELRSEYHELEPGLNQCGVDDAPSSSTVDSFENEWYKLGKKVIQNGSAIAARQYAKNGCPSGLRGHIWQHILCLEIDDVDLLYFDQLKNYVIQHDMLVDNLVMKDIRMTATNDDDYFVFEDLLYQLPQKCTPVLRCDVVSLYGCRLETKIRISFRSLGVLIHRDLSSLIHSSLRIQPLFGGLATGVSCGGTLWRDSQKAAVFEARSTGKLGVQDYAVVYPPNGVIPFHGFSMHAAPLCYVCSHAPRLYFLFRELYTRYFFRLHTMSSHPQVGHFIIVYFIRETFTDPRTFIVLPSQECWSSTVSTTRLYSRVGNLYGTELRQRHGIEEFNSTNHNGQNHCSTNTDVSSQYRHCTTNTDGTVTVPSLHEQHGRYRHSTVTARHKPYRNYFPLIRKRLYIQAFSYDCENSRRTARSRHGHGTARSRHGFIRNPKSSRSRHVRAVGFSQSYEICSIQAFTLRLVFNWMVYAFSGYLATDQVLLLWDRILAYDSMEVLPVLAMAVLSYRRCNLMEVTSLQTAQTVLADVSTLNVIALLQYVLFLKQYDTSFIHHGFNTS